MLKKIEKYLFILSPVLVLVSLFNYYISGRFDVLSIATLTGGLLLGVLFFVLFYHEIVMKITKRKMRYGANSVIISIVVIGLVVVVYLVLMDRNKKFDLTQEQRFTLSQQTRTVLAELDAPVKAYAFYNKQMSSGSIADLLERYQYINRDFDFEIVDPDLNPGLVEEMGVEEYGEVIIEYQGKREKVKAQTEEGITNTLVKLTQTEMKKVYFIAGHGERSIEDYSNDGYDKIAGAVEAEGYEVEELLLFNAPEVPADAATLIVAGPKTDFQERELQLIEEYLMSGGRAFFLLDPGEGVERLPNLIAFIEQQGIEVGNDIVIDPFSRVLSGDYFMPVVSSYTMNPITRNFRIATFYRLVRSVDIAEDSPEGVFARVIAHTSESSWAERDVSDLFQAQKAEFNEGTDEKGPVPIMAYATRSIPGSGAGAQNEVDAEGAEGGEQGSDIEAVVTVVGDSDFAANAMFQTQGNKDLFLNTVNYLSDRGELVTIRPKQQESVYLTLTAQQGRLAFFVTVLLVPLFVIAVGLYITVQRRVRT
jgi:ABC-type uncharacterized transport system involved in gliding motility auxiliary subunit